MLSPSLSSLKSSIQAPGSVSSPTVSQQVVDVYSDSRRHGYQGPTRHVVLPHASNPGSSSIAKSGDGIRCVVAGRESLRVLRVADDPAGSANEHKFMIGKGGHRIDTSKNLWIGSGLKVDSVSTDVVWCHRAYNHKVITSARNGEVMVWDLNKSGQSKLERRSKDHSRAVNKLSYSELLPHYMLSGAADGDMRLWDLRDMTKSVLWVSHRGMAIRTLMFSPSPTTHLHAVVGLDNGSIHRWDLRLSQRGQLDRLAMAHTGPILGLDWCATSNSGSWLATAGYDKLVKVWDLSSSADSSANTQPTRLSEPTYTLHSSFPVRRIAWRPGYETELAISSSNEYGYQVTPTPSLPSVHKISPSDGSDGSASNRLSGIGSTLSWHGHLREGGSETQSSPSDSFISASSASPPLLADHIEIWDIRRPWMAKWVLDSSNVEGGVTDLTFRDSHALWAQHHSGAFSQLDLRHCTKPMDSISRSVLTWEASGNVAFATDKKNKWEVPYDDVDPNMISPENKASKSKLGDATFVPDTQVVGSTMIEHTPDHWKAFAHMAKRYRLHGPDRTSLCDFNAKVAEDASQPEAAQIWQFLASLLVDLVPRPQVSASVSPAPPTSSLGHSISISSSVPALEVSPVKQQMKALQSAPFPRHRRVRSGLSLREGVGSSDGSTLVQGASSATPTSPSATSVSASMFESPQKIPPYPKSRRQSSMSVLGHARLRGAGRRSSMSSHSMHSDSPNAEMSRSFTSLRHVGEGALDDSDSSEDSSVVLSDAASVRSGSASVKRTKRQTKSPLSKDDAGWVAEDGVDETASPGSSDTDSDDSLLNEGLPTTSERMMLDLQESQSPLSMVPKSLSKPPSRNSVRTVTGESLTLPDSQPPINPIQELDIGSRRGSTTKQSSSPFGKKASMAHSIYSIQVQEHKDGPFSFEAANERFMLHNHKHIADIEAEYRQACFMTLRDILDSLSDNGDVQLCAMLACVAQKELRLKRWRVLRFVEAYIDVLYRLRLHTTAAYLRKFVDVPELQQTTLIQTTFQTVCSRCGKVMAQSVAPNERRRFESLRKNMFCSNCKSAAMSCSVCHLTVRSLSFVCTACSHGGHLHCYQRFFKERPATHTTSSINTSGSYIETATLPVDMKAANVCATAPVTLIGQPCPAGCGHICRLPL